MAITFSSKAAFMGWQFGAIAGASVGCYKGFKQLTAFFNSNESSQVQILTLNGRMSSASAGPNVKALLWALTKAIATITLYTFAGAFLGLGTGALLSARVSKPTPAALSFLAR